MKSRALNLAALALLVSLCGWIGAGVRPAAAQALDAGKPPAQIFSGTCSACHRSPRGLVRSVSPGSLPGFLRQHYTTGNEMAGVMAAYVLGSGGTQQVAEPPKREPKQKAKSDAPDVAARTPEPKEQSKAARQKAAKKGQPEPAARETPVAREPEKEEKPDKVETAKPEPAAEPPKTEAATVECKVEAPATPAVAAAEDDKPPRQPTSLLTLPGFPPPVPEPEPEPVATEAQPGCEPPATASASAAPAEAAPKAEPKEQPSAAPAAEAEAPKPEPPRSAVTEATATLDIMQEEVHAPRPARTAPQKKRAP